MDTLKIKKHGNTSRLKGTTITKPDPNLMADGDRRLGKWMRQVPKMSYLKLIRQSSLQEQMAFFDKLENYMLNIKEWKHYNAIKKCEKYKQLMSFLNERMKNTAKLDAVIDERQKIQIDFQLPEGWEGEADDIQLHDLKKDEDK